MKDGEMEYGLKILKALADQNRLRIIAALNRFNEMCACQITELLGITGASVSRHMALLTDATLLTSRKQGRWVYFSLNDTTKDQKLMDWVIENFRDTELVLDDYKKLKKIMAADPEEICRKQRGEKCCPIK